MRTERTGNALLVDGTNLYAHASKLGGRIDYVDLAGWCEATFGPLFRRAYYTPVEDRDENPFVRTLDWLDYNGWITNRRLYRSVPGEFRPTTDVALAVDALVLAPRAESLIVASGNESFVPMVAEAQRLGTRVVVLAAQAFAGDALRRQADTFVPLESILREVARPIERL